MATRSAKTNNEACNATLTVAFLLEEDIKDWLSDTLAQLVAGKVLEWVDLVISCMFSMLNFMSASHTSQVETMLMLKEACMDLVNLTKSLSKTTNNLANIMAPTLVGATNATPHTSWDKIAALLPHPTIGIPAEFNPMLAPKLTCLQQHLLRGSCMKGNAELHDRTSKLLCEIDSAGANLVAIDGVAPEPTKTIVQGVQSLGRRGYLFELDSADLAACFRAYMDDPEWKLVETCVGDMARVQKKAYHLIV
ncbi:hypothetical protein H2248_002272, partial [Termitomyces sp. 'cryptogamus']